RVVADGPFALLEAVRLNLLRDQVALGDLDLLVLGIAREPDDLHAVHQRLRHAQRVGRGDEHHIGQVVIDLEVMVLKARILLRIGPFIFFMRCWTARYSRMRSLTFSSPKWSAFRTRSAPLMSRLILVRLCQGSDSIQSR